MHARVHSCDLLVSPYYYATIIFILIKVIITLAYSYILYAICYVTFSVFSRGGRVTNVVGTTFRKVFVGTRARPI